MRLQRFVGASLWLLPIGCLAAGALVALGTLAVDRATDYRLIPQSLTGTPSDAQFILSSFATAMVSLTTLVLTVTLVAVQLAMGQFSPRIVGALLTDRWSQLAIGLFGATFLVTVLTLREIRGSDTGTVPGLSMLLSYVLMLASIIVLILFVHHAGHGLRVAALIDLVGDRSREFIVREHGDLPVVTGGPDAIVAAEPGNVIRVDRPALVAAARRADCVLELVPVVGDFVVGGAPLFRVLPGTRSTAGGDADLAGRLRMTDVARHVLLAEERVHTEDLAYGFRKLVDIAVRSIAQPFNDPTTAVQALHRLHDLLRQIAARPLPCGEHRDEDGVVRLIERTVSWDGYVRLAFDEIRLAGASEPQVSRKLCAALADLKCVAPADRQEPLDRQLRLLDAAVRRAYDDEEDVLAALTPDTEGIGSGADVTRAPPSRSVPVPR
ncbi:DUF2254 domain-containing protein [Blastococcus sp. CT_GayMR20]|uniref:DUF2254 domain-containing protein n=1 Tax=Blastococcus sp. CT_GayMR20 TaxID=2559609 RepID=UPI0010732DCB|nr:DUF2254 domain-containing protein [Blastococcus sp. CT_GayMR20]TFV91913.1 DUF2254 domain-containing protein [Blastococcus sp. CT_GayMR20]TFV91914.1 DUF2254 domain-containing protein [Blastococcus sp. CT_GayMR20]